MTSANVKEAKAIREAIAYLSYAILNLCAADYDKAESLVQDARICIAAAAEVSVRKRVKP